MDLKIIKNVAIAAAYKGGELLCNSLGKISIVNKKGAIDSVTEADIGSEKRIIETIRAAISESCHSCRRERHEQGRGGNGVDYRSA